VTNLDEFTPQAPKGAFFVSSHGEIMVTKRKKPASARSRAGVGGAPKGNNNAGKAKIWTAAIERALAKRGKKGGIAAALEELAEKFLAQCDKGDLAAFRELGDRMQGKSVAVIGTDDDKPIPVTGIVLELKSATKG
jgi:hypothetical protein